MNLLSRLALRRVRLSVKLSIIGGLIGLALIATVHSLYSTLTDAIEVALKEKTGVTMHRAGRALLKDLQNHRGSSNSVLSGRAEFKGALDTARKGVDAAAIELDQLNTRYGKALGTLDAWTALKTQWAAVRELSSGTTPADNLMRHNKLVDATIEYLDQISRDSGLVLDPEAASFYVMLAMIMTEPRATADLGQSRSVGMLILSGTAKPDHPGRLIALATMSADRETTIKRALDEAIKADPALRGQLEQAIGESAAATTKFLTAANMIGSDKDAAKIEPKDYFAMGGAATAARYKLYETASVALEKLLIERCEQKFLHRLLVVGGVSLLLAITLLFATIILRDITQRLARTAALADAAAQGRFDQKIQMLGSDEVAQVAGAVMRVRDQLERLSEAQLTLQTAHRNGDTDYRIDASSLPGGFGVLATKLNELVESNNAITFRFMEVVRQYSRGEFSAEMPRLPGKQAAITEAADTVRVTLLALAKDIDRIAAEAGAGKFDGRIDTRNYGATFGEMADALNELMQSIGASLDSTQTVFRALANGDLTQRMHGRFEGAFAELQDNSNLTAERLQGLVEEIITAARAVDTGAREIAVGNSDLSRRTDEQAASLQEAGSALRLISDVVQRTADHAKQADQLAQSASTVATRGGQTMGQVITTMQELGASARKVQEIIGVIDGIAFQTNILALNASVESARAGELGKGFAVVAAEVRMLAQRAAGAAREIKELITETVSRVETSTTLVGHTGEQMEEIVQSVKRVTDLIGEISAASAAQTQELTEVHAAVTSIDSMTQRSAALAEQVAASTSGMREHADQLVEKVSVFRTSESGRPLRAAA